MSAVKFEYKTSDFPRSFDAREKWPGKITDVSDQGWCGASWAFSTVSVATDRFAIENQGSDELSAQALISCNTQGQSGCRGGHVDRAWNFLRRFGTVPDSCYPFEDFAGYDDEGGVGSATCRLPRSSLHRVKEVLASLGRECSPLKGRRSLFRTQPAYRVGRRNTPRSPKRRELDIMYEVMTRGPVQALMEVKRDFFAYASGIYRPNALGTSAPSAFHSVKIIGWGETDDGLKYWSCANSWGRNWGENGLFRIERGSNACRIEEFVVGVWAQSRRKRTSSTEMSTRRRRRLRIAAFSRRKAEMERKRKDAKHVQAG